MEQGFVLVVTGAAAGFAGGLFGIGGGLLIVPALAFVFADQLPALGMHMAVATSLAIIVPTAIASTWAHHRRGAVRWGDVTALAPAVTLGVLMGVVIAAWASGRALAVTFGLYAVAMAAHLALNLRPTAPARALPPPALPALDMVGVMIGTLSALIGIGGGTIITPYLLWRGRGMHAAVGTSAACAVPIALVGCLAYIVAGWNAPGMPPWSSGYVYWPAFLIMVVASTAAAPLGAHQAHRLPERTLRTIFAALLLVIGIKMLLG